MDSVFVVYSGGEWGEILNVWPTREEAEEAVVRDIKRGAWYGGCELEDVTESDIQQAWGEYRIVEAPFAKDDDRLGTGLVIDGVPLA